MMTDCNICEEKADVLLQRKDKIWECLPCHVRRVVREELSKALVMSPTGPKPIVVIEE